MCAKCVPKVFFSRFLQKNGDLLKKKNEYAMMDGCGEKRTHEPAKLMTEGNKPRNSRPKGVTVRPYTFCSQRIAKRGSGEKRCGEMWKNKERKFYNLRKKYYLCARKSNSHRPIESVQEEFTAPLSRRMKGLCTNIKQNETRYPSRKLPRGSIQRHVKRRCLHFSFYSKH